MPTELITPIIDQGLLSTERKNEKFILTFS
jgi:hypothetical protein